MTVANSGRSAKKSPKDGRKVRPRNQAKNGRLSNACPIGLRIGEAVRCEWVGHGKILPKDAIVVMANPEYHHTVYAVLVETGRERRGNR